MNRVLIINTGKNDLCVLQPLFRALKDRNKLFWHLSPHKQNCDPGEALKQKKLPTFFNLERTLSAYVFLCLLPLLWLLVFFVILYIKIFENFQTIICCHYQEKICLTRIASWLKINVIWLEMPENSEKKIISPLEKLLSTQSKKAKTICFTGRSKILLEKKSYKKENLYLVAPGISQKSLQRQENIFGEIAHNSGDTKKRKFFTVGIVNDLNNQKIGDKLEKIFQAVKKSLIVVPFTQIIVVGEGEERKNLGWQTKKLEIDNLIWFVGGPNFPRHGSLKHLKRWLDSFDCLISATKNPDLNELHITLYAMSNGLPIIAPENVGFETIIDDQRNGSLINMDNSDEIAQSLIKLQQSKELRAKFSQEAAKDAQERFTISRSADQFEQVLGR